MPFTQFNHIKHEQNIDDKRESYLFNLGEELLPIIRHKNLVPIRLFSDYLFHEKMLRIKTINMLLC